VQNSLCVQVLRSPILAALLHCTRARHSSIGREPNFAAWYKEWNQGTFIEGAAPPIWLRGPAVEHRSLADVLSLSCARLVADG